MKYFMLDIETLALDARSAVWAVAIVEFHGDKVRRHFTATLQYREQNHRRATDATIQWTKAHGDAEGFAAWGWGRNASHSAEELHAAIKEFLPDYATDPYMLWCKGAKFDFAILQDYFQEFCGAGTPWHYRAEACMRTVGHIYQLRTGEKYAYGPVSHNALQDCHAQVADLQKMCHEIL